MGRMEGRPLTDHTETKDEHWRILETGRRAGLMTQGRRIGDIQQARLTVPGHEKKT